MGYITLVSNNLSNYFLTTSFKVGFNLLCASTDDLWLSKSIQCIHIKGHISFKLATDQPMVALCSRSTLNSFSSSTSKSEAEIITGNVED